MQRKIFSVFMVAVLLLAVSFSISYAETKTNTKLVINLFGHELNVNSAPETEVSVFKMGETASTDEVEFTLNDFKFADRVGIDRDDWFECRQDGRLATGDGKVFVWVSFTAKNLSKDYKFGAEYCDIVVEYGDGYVYDESIFTDEYGKSTASWLTPGLGLIRRAPLETCDYCGVIKCMDVVRTDREAPLYAVVTLPSSHGDVKVKFELDNK